MWNTVAFLVCFISGFRIALFEKLKMRLSFFEVFISYLNILKVMSPFSRKMIMHYQETLF